jgi:hypothetical protein
MAKKVVRESKDSYVVEFKSKEPFDKPVIIKHKGRRVAAVIPLADYQEFVAWKRKQRALEPKPTRRTRVPRKRKQGDLTKLIGIIQAEPSGETIDWSKIMNKHGYEQIDRDDS